MKIKIRFQTLSIHIIILIQMLLLEISVYLQDLIIIIAQM